ncbi:MAG: hypothetical protein JXQ65_10465 [Candidatus Marinimicrobia bacterium]|nr:hypothetical protein [Candidatus Neomarinimicrobiota bacterium]
MGRPLNEFAGWLRFFQIVVLVNLMMNILTGVTLVESLFQEPDKILTLGSLVQFGFVMFLLYKILKLLPIPLTKTPEKIKEYLFYMFILAIVHFVFFTSVTLLVFQRKWSLENNLAFFSAFNLMVWSAFWRTYFERSKRVRAYYSHATDIRVI